MRRGMHTFLRSFLEACMLSTDAETSVNDSADNGVCSHCYVYIYHPFNKRIMFLQKVTITTCHAAKGLEWPVVMIPAGMQPVV